MMNRRALLKNGLIISAAAIVFPSCLRDDKGKLIVKNFLLSAADEALLADLTATILPSSKSFIGAADVKAHEFVVIMMDDCKSPEEQQKFTEGLKAFDNYCKKNYQSEFVALSAPQKIAALTAIEKNTADTDTSKYFYLQVKKYTIQAFTTCKQYMTTIAQYKMVPGPNFQGCVPII